MPTRRTFLKTTAACTALPFATGAASAAPGSYSGVVVTRGHFGLQTFGDPELIDGNTRTNYDTTGEIPGLTDDSSPDELVVFVHGFQRTPAEARRDFSDVTAALRANGYEQPVVGFSWDSDWGEDQWDDARTIADRNADKLGTFIRDYTDASPDTDVRLVGYCLAAKTLAETLEFFYDRGYDTTVTSTAPLGGAIDDDEVATDGEYGSPIAEHTGTFRNYYWPDDDDFEWDYRWAEFDTPVGTAGCEGTAPGNYEDIEVSPDNHDSYYRPDTGVMPTVVEQWG
ncbi:alpha/beta hydrolase [Halorientalis marina]|uniref:alpha/beta hydrolase n=1 Tax=Halorientalis marina TaxID=2931976 RepID=UPI001FF40F56|nr:alpha/beta hydrolase [Halorientalis marina]